jgi:endonuclease/exonuclease/phosphatase family metal-dependent hydrolase
MRALASARTFPADAPNRQLDHILTDDHQLRGGAVESDLMTISDHRPLLVDLQRV